MLLMANGRTLADLPALLNDNDFRDVMLESVEKRKTERSEFTTHSRNVGTVQKTS